MKKVILLFGRREPQLKKQSIAPLHMVYFLHGMVHAKEIKNNKFMFFSDLGL